MEYNWTGLNVKLLAASALLFCIGAILVSCKESRRSSCTLQKILYCASGTPSGIYWCANCRPTWCGRPELCAYWLTQNRRFLWLVTHKTALHWYERLARSSGTKIIGNSSYRRDFSIYRREDVLFQLKIRGASEKFKNQPRPLLRPTSVNFWQYCRNLSHATVPLSSERIQFVF